MKIFLALLLAVPVFAATHLDWGQTIRLDDGVSSIRIFDEIEGVEQTESVVMSIPLDGAAYARLTFWAVPYRISNTPSNCVAPCEVRFERGDGSVRAFVEYLDASNNVLRSGILIVPQSAASQACNAPPPMPIELLGFSPYRQCVQVSTQIAPTGPIRFYAKTHRVTYPTKVRVLVGNSGWQSVQRANVTLIDHQRAYNFAGSMDFSQDIAWWTMTLPAGSVVSGANRITWEFAEQLKGQIGSRLLEFNLLEAEKTISSITVSGNTATLTIVAHGYSTGDDLLIENFPGVLWRLNRIKQNITVTGPDTFTVSFSNPKTVNGTWTYPNVKASRLLINPADFTQANPSTWTAPAGGNSATGATLANTAALREQDGPLTNITAKCTSCHASGLRDLKYFGFSNRSIRLRSEFHGLTRAEGDHIAAYVRANASPTVGRAWYNPFQPCPAADTVPVYEWSGACSEDEVLPNEMGMLEQLASNGQTMTTADWSPTRTDLHFRTARISFQLLSLFEWWPRIYPGDVWSGPNCGVYAKGCFETSDLKVGYDQIYEDLGPYCPGTGTTCQDRVNFLATNPSNGRRQMSGKRLVNFQAVYGQTPYCVGNPADVECTSRFATAQNHELVKTYAAAQWDAIKSWEVEHVLQTGQYGLTWYPDGGVENARIVRYSNAFGSSPNLMRARLNNAMVGILDGSGETESFVSMQWYHLAGILRSQGNKCCANQSFDGIQPLDPGYTYGYFFALDVAAANVELPLVHALWLQQNFRRYINTSPVEASGARRWDINILRPYIFTQQNFQTAFSVIPAADRDAVRTNLVDSSLTKFTAIFCGDEANGSAAPFTAAAWNATGGRYDPVRIPVFPSLFAIGNGTGNDGYASAVAHAAAFGGAYGLNQTTRDRLATCGDAIWKGPNSTLNGAMNDSQTTFTMAAGGTGWPTSNVQVVIGTERINCTNRSGSTFSGCMRGAESTTPASHLNGDTVQMRIRWTKYSTVSCPKTGDSVNCDGQDLYP